MKYDEVLALPSSDISKTSALNVLKAVATKDKALLERAAAGFDAMSLIWLRAWAYEAITLRWNIFSKEESFGLADNTNFPRRLLLDIYKDGNVKLLVQNMMGRYM